MLGLFDFGTSAHLNIHMRLFEVLSSGSGAVDELFDQQACVRASRWISASCLSHPFPHHLVLSFHPFFQPFSTALPFVATFLLSAHRLSPIPFVHLCLYFTFQLLVSHVLRNPFKETSVSA